MASPLQLTEAIITAKWNLTEETEPTTEDELEQKKLPRVNSLLEGNKIEGK